MVSPKEKETGDGYVSVVKKNRSKFISPGHLKIGQGRGRGRGLGLKNFLLSPIIGENSDGIVEATNILASSSIKRANTKRKSTATEYDALPTLPIEDAAVVGEETIAPIHQNEDTTAANVPHSSQVEPPCVGPIQINWKPRGRNRCQKVSRLEEGGKLPVTFFNGRAAGVNSNEWSRHLGRLIRDRNILPIRLSRWDEVDERCKKHLWSAVTEKFSNDDIQNYKDSTLRHMQELWNKWRGTMHKTIKGLDIDIQLKRKPKCIEDQGDWEWLVKNHYHSPKFEERSKKNSNNRLMLNNESLHRSGSKPYREIAYELGGKNGSNIDYGSIYFESHRKGKEMATPKSAEVYAKIIETQVAEPSLTHIEVVERVHGEMRTRGYVAGYGGGVKAKDVRGPYKSKSKLLEDLKVKEAALKKQEAELEKSNQELGKCSQENQLLKDRLDRLEPTFDKIINSAQFRFLMESEDNLDDLLASPSEDIC